MRDPQGYNGSTIVDYDTFMGIKNKKDPNPLHTACVLQDKLKEDLKEVEQPTLRHKGELENRLRSAECALQRITKLGRVCANFEHCTHESCADSCGACLEALQYFDDIREGRI